jgi:hypothetical protein
MDEQGAQIRITSLADTQQNLFAAGGMLSRHQAEPSS